MGGKWNRLLETYYGSPTYNDVLLMDIGAIHIFATKTNINDSQSKLFIECNDIATLGCLCSGVRTSQLVQLSICIQLD